MASDAPVLARRVVSPFPRVNEDLERRRPPRLVQTVVAFLLEAANRPRGGRPERASGEALSCAARSCVKFFGNAFETDCERGSTGYMRAMILAAGYGTRLWPLTIDRTKPA